MSGAHSRVKGRRFENEVVGTLRANGYEAERISEAGLAGPDIRTFYGRMCEAKIRRVIGDVTPGLILKALEDVAAFFWRVDREPILVTLPLDEMLDIMDDHVAACIKAREDEL